MTSPTASQAGEAIIRRSGSDGVAASPSRPATQEVNWNLRYDIHLGATWSRFMDGLRQRKLLANSCASCSRVFVPPQAYCESCFEPTAEWLELPAEGTLEVYTVAWHGFTGGPTPPYAIGGIRLDGASTLLMHHVVGVDFDSESDPKDALPFGTRVRAVWAEERVGHVLDISHFEPAS
ncbi:Zn-ribbon domain-containing OB-fold protein [Nocardioides sp.]|uniref:Zn-ribbon domain-containing OB-fold protein n=1 Tax=Nocardioides sp. TaxID=35761 RepID=UPI0026209695|nr:Zn-ribbon domain-containing OB-fold protein [Nocardioides sp.]MDI6909226.1 Zn-ribbon domain-containing OB-fold protein [Nocardioides sp.]